MTSLGRARHEAPERTVVVLGGFAVLLGAFYVIDQLDVFYTFSRRELDIGMGAASAVVAGGDTARRAAFVLLGALGVLGLLRPRLQAVHMHGALALLMTLAAGCIALSPLWADDPGVSARRAAAFLLLAVGAVGIARRWPMERVVLFALLVPAAIVALGLVMEIASGRFAPFTEGHRFYGLSHANRTGSLLGILVLAALCLARLRPQARWLLVLLAGAAVVLLAATRSRTAMLALLAALAVWWTYRDRAPGRAVGLLVLPAVIGGALALLALGDDVPGLMRSLVLLGRDADTDPTTLTGRIPLWTHLIERYVAEHPLLGHGYGAFWTADRLLDVSEHFDWAIYYSHSGFVEVLLDLGIVGLGLFVAILLGGLARTFALYRQDGDPLWLFVAGVFVWHLAGSVPDAIAPYPELRTFLVVLLLAKVAMAPRAVAAREAAPDQAVARRSSARRVRTNASRVSAGTKTARNKA